MRELVAPIAIWIAAMSACGCADSAGRGAAMPVETAGGSAASSAALPVRPASSTAPASQPALLGEEQVMAYVNGQPITMRQLLDVLVQSYGMHAAQQVIACELVAREARKANVAVTDEDVRQESDRTLKDMLGSIPQSDQRERILEQFLVRSRVSRQQWTLMMHRNAMLAKLVAPKVKVTEDMLREAFAEQSGRKVVVRHIETKSLSDAQALLKELRETKADFATMALRHSINATGKNGGLLPPIGESTDIVPVIRKTALAMKNVGDLSDPIQAGTAFHILKLEEILPPTDLTYEQARPRLVEEQSLRQSRILMEKTLQELLSTAKIEYVNPILKAQVEGAQP